MRTLYCEWIRTMSAGEVLNFTNSATNSAGITAGISKARKYLFGHWLNSTNLLNSVGYFLQLEQNFVSGGQYINSYVQGGLLITNNKLFGSVHHLKYHRTASFPHRILR